MEQRPEVAKSGVFWHAINSAEALRLMETGNDGLRQEEVLVRREK